MNGIGLLDRRLFRMLLVTLACLLSLSACSDKGDKAEGDGHQHAEEAKVQYTCPMHPFIIKDQPGTCPICGMDLVKKSSGTAADSAEIAKIGEVAISTTQRVMANVAVIHADAKPLTKEIAATGIVAYDQRRQAKVTAWVAGRIDRLLVNAVGDQVTKGRPVADIYAPDLVSAQQEYLLALKSRDQLKQSTIPSISQGGEDLAASARQRLLLLGVTEKQIAHLESSGQTITTIPIYTPVSGIVVEKQVLEGQYVTVGEPLFAVADLSTVWVDAEVFEGDISFVRPGQRVEITSTAWPGKSFKGRVLMLYPFLDPKTRTIKARIELANPGLLLKPDMFVQTTLKVALPSSVVVPSSAVMDTGTRQMVWIQVKDGVFEPRQVKVGARVGDEVQILQGLTTGEVIASSGAYLIDSESQLRGGPAPGTDTGSPASSPQTPATKHDDMKIDDMKM